MNKIAFIYPGQGAQKAGMGKDFYAYSPLAAEIYDKASEILNIDMKALCFEENDLLDQTEYTQAAMVTTCLAMTAVLEEAGLNPDVTAGLSLGEYCAIASAGGMTTEDAIRLVRKRGILMQNTVPKGKGAMAAVIGAETELIEKCLAPIEDVSIANYNCPGQIVITGKKIGGGAGGGSIKNSRCQKMRHAECQRTVPFTDDDSGRRSAGSGDGRYAVVRTENPLCDQCHSGICHRYS